MTVEQIEKETESYGADLCAYCRECEGENPCQHKIDTMHGYKDGLKAGYHEGFKDCAKSRLNVTTISDCPIKDEWHYVKNGDFPKEEKDYLVYLKEGDIDVMAIALDGDLEPYLLTPCYNFYEDVIAWKEITPPKEIKEND